MISAVRRRPTRSRCGIDVGPSGKQLPPGGATAAPAEQVFAAIGQSCSGTSEDEVARTVLLAWIAVTSLFGVHAMSVDGLITLRSSFGPQETMRRLEAEVSAKGLTV